MRAAVGAGTQAPGPVAQRSPPFLATLGVVSTIRVHVYCVRQRGPGRVSELCELRLCRDREMILGYPLCLARGIKYAESTYFSIG